uniref:Uncharacterized protein n=1 Tax=Dicentrarchus labrax TaxID=13489 RepID=A0A8C4HYZ6_DICLA
MHGPEAQCWHGCGEEGTLLHMLWHCPVIESLWREVAHFLSGILKVDLQLSPITCLLGARAENIQSNKHQRVVSLACLSTKRMILMNWKIGFLWHILITNTIHREIIISTCTHAYTHNL